MSAVSAVSAVIAVSAIDLTHFSLFSAILQTTMNPVGLRYQKSANLRLLTRTLNILYCGGGNRELPKRRYAVSIILILRSLLRGYLM
jgi:hypothetical protein